MEKVDVGGYPRPDFVREHWVSLNGEWDFSFDTEKFDRKIQVPYVYQSKKSGIGDHTYHEIVWYRKKFDVDMEKIPDEGGRLLLKFGAVDYEAEVFINDFFAGVHQGGHVPFAIDITNYVRANNNELKVKVKDGNETDKPRGKQNWIDEPFGCWYTSTTGIWQEVWLEYTGWSYIERIKITPDLSRNQALCEVFISDLKEHSVSLSAVVDSVKTNKQYDLGDSNIICRNGYGKCIIAIPDMDVAREQIVWTLQYPNLIYVHLMLHDRGRVEDKVITYFGMRSAVFRNRQFYLNDERCLQRLILDQGYWPDTLLTPPDSEALEKDIRLAKEMGFNGARKHQKIEDPRYYYLADRMGFLVWGELPSSYLFNDTMIKNAVSEMIAFVERDYNHPSIVTWVPINESWGVRNIRTETQQQAFSDMMIFLAKSLDTGRSISGNDGWEQTGNTDIIAIHDYSLAPETIEKYEKPELLTAGAAERRVLLADGQTYRGQSLMITEYGGIAFARDDDGWGYYNKVESEDEFLDRIEPVTEYLISSGRFAGFCYTQLTDVMQEKNGLLTEERVPKISVEKLKKIFGKKNYEQ